MTLQNILDSTELLNTPEQRPMRFTTGYSTRVMNKLVESGQIDKIKDSLKSFPIIDVPCGDCNSVYSLLSRLLAIDENIAYIGVDRYMIKDGFPRDMRTEFSGDFQMTRYRSNKDKFDLLFDSHKDNVRFECEDALLYLSRLEPKSVNVIIAGLEADCIIRSRGNMYHKALEEQVRRVVAPEGFFMDVGNGHSFEPFGEKIEILSYERGYLHFRK